MWVLTDVLTTDPTSILFALYLFELNLFYLDFYEVLGIRYQNMEKVKEMYVKLKSKGVVNFLFV